LALAVPLSRFTSRVGGGSAFYVRQHYALMFSKLTIFALAVMLSGCSSVRPSAGSTWRAFDTNGDKPGTGIELSHTPRSITGFIYILDPNKPGDFDAGSRRRMVIRASSEQEICFSVHWFPDLKEDLVLRLATPLTGGSVHGVLQQADGQSMPLDFVFTRIQ